MGDVLSFETAGSLMLIGCYCYESLHHFVGTVRKDGLRRASSRIELPSLAIATGYGLLCAGKLAKGVSVESALTYLGG